MKNKVMRFKIDKGQALDICYCRREGIYYVLECFNEDVDYCDSLQECWIWSIGKRHKDGMILASADSSLHNNPLYQCLWVR